MPKYAQVYGGKVVCVCDSPNQMVEVDNLDDNLLGTSYVDGAFVGFKIILTTDKSTIAADGVDAATITATVYNWDGTIATDYALPITFTDGAVSTSPITPTNGVAKFAYDTAEAGVYSITASVEDPYLIDTQTVEVTAA